MSDQLDQRSDEASMADRQEVTAVDGRLNPDSTIARRPSQTPSKNTTNTTNPTDIAPPAGPVNSYFASLLQHYAQRSDKVTPHLFAQLGKDYRSGQSDEQSFYMASYRLLFETNATHLAPGLRTFLPSVWGELELGWLHEEIENDSKRDREAARENIGDLARLMENFAKASDVSIVSPAAVRGLDLEANPTAPAAEKKRKPIRGFRATYDPPPNEIDTPLCPLVPATQGNSTKKSSHHLSPAIRASPSFNRHPTISPSLSTAKSTSRKQTKTKTKLPTSPLREVSEPSSPTSTLATKRESKPLPLASAVRHLGPIYPSTRAVLARSHKPYIHAMCGQRFGHPAEVQRHHNGQSGRPGCWEKSGKPDGEDGQWDRDVSCKIKLSDLEYMKVQEGWVVTSWGSANVEGVREGEDEEVDGGTVVASTTEPGKGMKRKAVAKSKPAVEARVESENLSEDAEGSDESPEPEEPRAKRQKVVKTEQCGPDAAVRAAALGLRTRK
jgi:hypothetical protein